MRMMISTNLMVVYNLRKKHYSAFTSTIALSREMVDNFGFLSLLFVLHTLSTFLLNIVNSCFYSWW